MILDTSNIIQWQVSPILCFTTLKRSHSYFCFTITYFANEINIEITRNYDRGFFVQIFHKRNRVRYSNLECFKCKYPSVGKRAKH